ncbi:hypothetical protein E4U42_005364 [Claviceps africana]|uniref:Secreted protein n=1 Tax=Claviceps africana TaxID=83212 RepID=A0A8K0J3S5_9HYPO|nr:hypothetical protein E4U42_005364 [Claviceps africana]
MLFSAPAALAALALYAGQAAAVVPRPHPARPNLAKPEDGSKPCVLVPNIDNFEYPKNLEFCDPTTPNSLAWSCTDNTIFEETAWGMQLGVKNGDGTLLPINREVAVKVVCFSDVSPYYLCPASPHPYIVDYKSWCPKSGHVSKVLIGNN